MYVFKKRGADTWGYRLFYLWRQRSSQTLVIVHFLGPRPVDKLLYPHSTPQYAEAEQPFFFS